MSNAENTSQSLKVRPSQAKPIILRAMLANRPIFIWGPPGIGKSEMVADLGKDPANGLGDKVLIIDLRLALMEPTDLRGYPFRNTETNQMEWAPPVDLPSPELAAEYDTIILFLDEMNSAPPSVQAAAYQLVLNKRIGQYFLPKNVRIIAAGNRDTDRGTTYKMPSPLANRFRHIEMEVNFKDWKQWAITNKLSPEIIGYVSFSKQDLFDFQPTTSGHAFATPRSWVYINEMLQQQGFHLASDIEQKAEIAGAVGDAIAGKFCEHRKHAAFLPNPSDILAGNVKKLEEQITENISAKYTLTVSMAYEINEVFKNEGLEACYKFINNATRFAFNNFNPEMVILLFQTMMKDYKIRFDFRKVLAQDLMDTFNKEYLDLIL